jgi:hypothetical protein
VNDESENPKPVSPWNAFPSEQIVLEHPVSPTSVTRIHQEIPSKDIGDISKIAKGGIAPRTCRPHRVSRPGDLQRRKHTRPLLRVKKFIEVATLEGARQKQVQPEAPKIVPPPPLGSQEGIGDDSKKATEAKIGFRRRQCTRPLLRENSRRKIASRVPSAA